LTEAYTQDGNNMDVPQPVCEVKLALTSNLAVASQSYAQESAMLSALASTSDHQRFNDAKKRCEESQSDCDSAKIALDDHCKVHGC
jgi:hypothetical protein